MKHKQFEARPLNAEGNKVLKAFCDEYDAFFANVVEKKYLTEAGTSGWEMGFILHHAGIAKQYVIQALGRRKDLHG